MPSFFKRSRPARIVLLLVGMAGFASAQDPLALPPLPPDRAPARPPAQPDSKPAKPDSKPAPSSIARDLPPALPSNPPRNLPNRASGPLGPAVDRGDATQGGAAGTVANTGSTPGTGGANTTGAAVNAPTVAEAANAGPSETDFLARFLGIQDAPVKVYGWIENSFTGNANGRPANGINFGVFPNHLADQWQGNQYYLALERQLTPTDMVNFGGRFDTLFGNDWQFSKSYGLFDRAFKPNSFAGVDLPQMFAEVHLPILTKNGLDIRGGRFYSPAGFENVQAIKRPLLSVPYLFNYTPFTLFGVLTTLHINERINFYNGAVNGWDRWIDQNYRYSYIGGINYNSRDLKTSLTSIVLTGPDQLPRFAPANSPFLPTGVITNATLQGKVNPDYAGNWRTYNSTVLTHNYNARLTEAAEVFFVHETNVPGLGPNGSVGKESAWYGGCHWFLYQFTDKVQGVWRSEIFRDNNGAATGSADNYYEVTLGAVYKPRPWLWVRPEARFDRAQYTHPFNDGTRSSQVTLAFDIIIQF
jgi:Putative beta-barrel porin-2, OmpL-like. bbp2